jgi:hypothetical protein
MKKSGNSTLGGISKSNMVPSGEKPGKLQLHTESSAPVKSNPLTASYDSRPRSGDNKPNATIPGGGKGGGKGSSSGGNRVKNVY